METPKDSKENKRGLIASSSQKTKTNIFIYLLKKGLLFSSGSREFLLKKFDKKLHEQIVEKDTTHIKAMQEKKYDFLMSMLTCTKRNIDKKWISKEVIERAINTLVKFGFVGQDEIKEIKEKFKEKYGILPPTFIVFSPTQKCNLNCVGCYASSKEKAPALPFETVSKIFDEVYNEWGNRFMTISGGEPLMYSDNGKTLFDLWKKYPQMFSQFYTNGTLITKEVAKKLAVLGNVTPAISIEGWEKETDERRGKGIFKKIIEASNNLKEAGTPFGFSITATAKNIDTLLDDKFYDYLFLELGASYIWMFQLMPIGQAKDLRELMLTPEERVKLFRKWEHLLKDKRYCIADFWNSGCLADGCIAYGRAGGYLYVDWNGNITPCVFVPFYEDNILDLHKKGKKLADALFSDLFVNGRKWQEEYGLNHKKSPDNWLMPCSIRDNWKNFRKNILSKKAKPEDEHAKTLLTSKEYDKFLTEFDEKLEKITKPIWEKEFLEKEAK